MKETRVASQGLVSEIRKAPFIGGPQACNTPQAMMMG
jgi:hypothetical protein